MHSPSAADWLIAQSRSLGFDLCGILPASELTPPLHREEWLARGYAGRMQYLHDPRRADPLQLLPAAKSIIVCGINYNTAHPYSTEAAASDSAAWLSRYAWGDDYHSVLGEKLDALIAAMREKFGANLQARSCVDTTPVSERLAAHHAGLGWLGKNTCLINEHLGSWLFLGVILTSLEFAPARGPGASAAAPPPDLCGNCSLCIDACPTGAIVEPYVLDASRCISYLTIELRDSIPEAFRPALGRHVFGCDVCQDICPWNRNAPATQDPAFAPRQNLLAPELEWLLALTEDDFRRIFKNSAVRRAKYRGLLRNACIAAGNSKAFGPALRARLAELAASPDPLIAEHAQWALSRML